jgi:hypothetical protein
LCGAGTLAREPREPAAAYVPEEFVFYGMREFTFKNLEWSLQTIVERMKQVIL